MGARLGRTALLVCALALGTLPFAPASQATQRVASDADSTFVWTDPAPPLPPGATKPRSISPRAGQVAAGLPIPALNSLPGSTHTLYLDFDGVTLASPNKWVDQSGITAGTYGGFSLDADPAFTATEIAFIQKTWRIVSEKYSPWDINVTTVDPGTSGLTRDSAADLTYGTQMVLTSDTALASKICASCSGKAWNDTYGKLGLNDYRIAFTLSSRLPSGSATYNAHTAAHEMGHTIGLGHDGGPADPNYYVGHGNWVPIMGISDQQAVAQFSKGEYAGANNFQDDLAIIGTHGNSGAADSLLRPDDAANTGSAPTALGDQTSYTIDGIISNAADDDLFSIDRTCTSAITVTAAGIGVGQSLDIKLDILDASNNVLATNNPVSGQITSPQADGDVAYTPTGLDATASLPGTSSGATYRIRVDGVGNPTLFSGQPWYTDYASIGQYHLTITGCPASVTTVPDAPATVTATPTARTTTGTVSWTAPGSNGGSAITGYQITGLPGGTVNLGNVLTYNATNLNPGTTYTVAVAAVNANGAGAAKTASLKVDTFAPITKPGLTATFAAGVVTATWTPPANPGNATLTGWHVVSTGASAINETLPAGTLTKDYPGLAVGTHSFTVTGVYTATDTGGIQTSDPKSVVVSAVPGAPASATGTPTSRTSTGTISWTTPASDGGSAITGYTVTGLPGGTVNTPASALSTPATGLTPGTTYNVDVRAVNANGPGPAASTTIKVDTWAPTAAPGLTATNTGNSSTATLTWTAPANPGGAVLTGWHVVGTGATTINDTINNPATLTKTYPGLGVGTTSFTVTGIYTATDTAGVTASAPKSVTLTGVPAAPATASFSPNARTTTGTLTWTPPGNNGGSAITGYQITGLPGGTKTLGNVLSFNATGLNPGDTYDVNIQAVNANGAGASKNLNNVRVPTWAPTTQPVLTVVVTGTTASLSWTVPANLGNAVLTGWQVNRTGPGVLPPNQTLSAGMTATTMTGLAAGTHTFTVTGTYTADDTAGIQASAPKSGVVTTAPDAPQNVVGTPNARTTTGQVTWTAPASNGGSAITNYIVSGLPGGPFTVGNVLVHNATGLNPGTTYNVTVAAKNAVGTGPTASATLTVATWAPLTKPGLTASVAASTATLTWAAPANPGNATLTGWHVVGTGASAINDTINNPATLTKDYPGLNVGTTTFTVTGLYSATDTAGIVSSDPTPVTVVAAVTAPQNLAATPNPRTTTGTVTWTAPVSDGGSAITGYRISGLPGTPISTSTPAVLSFNATGLTPGTTYTVQVQAINGGGPGPAATTSLKVDTWAPTTAPVLTATVVNGTTGRLSWTVPLNPGGATPTGWHVVSNNGIDDVISDPTTLTKDYPGLVAGTHTFTVTGTYTATDVAGVQASAPKSITVVTAPGVPQSLVATPASRATTGTVTWAAPASTGGSAITNYVITGLPGGTVTTPNGTTTTYDATGLVPGTTYTVGVAAKNAIGTGTAATKSLTVATWAPTTKPVLTAGRTGSTANLSWTAPANPGGATLTGWHVVGTGATTVDDTINNPATLAKDYPGLNEGTTSFTVTGVYTASDTAGVVASDPKTVTVTGLPGAPASATAAPNARTTTGTVSWTAPATNGGSAITGYRITGLPDGVHNLGVVLSYNATGLVPGTTYDIDIQALNVNGAGPARSTTLKVDTWAPTAKPVLTVGLTGSTANLSWTAPPVTGGATLTGWHVVATGASTFTEDLPAAPLTKSYPGLAVGLHTFTVTGIYTATDTAGIQASDPQSVTVTSTPGAPATLTATPHARTTTGTLAWTAPASNGGNPITGYKITGLPDGVHNLGLVLSYDATGLVPGTTYNVDVQAVTSAGAGTPRSSTLRVDTWAPTAKPVLTVVVSGSTASLSWTAPANPGGATLTGWHVARTGPGLLPSDQDLSAGILTTTMTGLAVGTHTFTVTATYTADDLAGVQGSDPKTGTVAPPVTAPSAPKIGTPSSGAAGGTVNAVARWAAPTSTGGSAITSYKVVAYKLTASGVVTKAYYSTPRSATARSYTWALPAGRYKFRVLAYNKVGASPYSSYSAIVLSR